MLEYFLEITISLLIKDLIIIWLIDILKNLQKQKMPTLILLWEIYIIMGN